MNFRERDIEDIYWELKVREFAERFCKYENEYWFESLKRICWEPDNIVSRLMKVWLKVSWEIASYGCDKV